MSERIGTKKLLGATEPVNPQFHDEFVALCALHPDELSDEEWAMLQMHMQFCDACHGRFLEYQRIRTEVIPAMAAVAAAEDPRAFESAIPADVAEKRLMDLIDSIPPKTEKRTRRWFNWTPTRVLIAAFGVAILGATGVLLRYKRTQTPTQVTQSSRVPAHAIEAASKSSDDLEQRLQRAQEDNHKLQEQLEASKGQLKEQSTASEQAQQQLATEQAAHSEAEDQKQKLSQQLFAAQSEATDLRTRLAGDHSDASEQTVRIATLETQIRELRASLEEKNLALSDKERMLALDQDFLAHDRDIRDLIGARNLYIADIFDTKENGKTAKQFGRIFYTKDRSLVFYGFDLDSQGDHKQNVSYQVWGSGSGRSSPVNLGLFYQDDSHKRWVLRCNDAKSLARLEMVFVTVEPPGGSAKPTGKPLLRAYLQIQPNHP